MGMRLLPESARRSTQLPSEPAMIIGDVHGGELWIIERADGSTAVYDERTGRVERLNTDRAATSESLAAFAAYFEAERADEPSVMTAARAAERLTELRAGQIRPGVRSQSGESRRDRVKTLRRRLTQIDAKALGRGSWWRICVEQIQDDIL